MASIAPASAATSAASAVMAIKAGSAAVVPNPRQKAKASRAVMLPFLAKHWASTSPRGAARFQSLDEEGQPGHHAYETQGDVPDVGEGNLQKTALYITVLLQ